MPRTERGYVPRVVKTEDLRRLDFLPRGTSSLCVDTRRAPPVLCRYVPLCLKTLFDTTLVFDVINSVAASRRQTHSRDPQYNGPFRGESFVPGASGVPSSCSDLVPVRRPSPSLPPRVRGSDTRSFGPCDRTLVAHRDGPTRTGSRLPCPTSLRLVRTLLVWNPVSRCPSAQLLHLQRRRTRPGETPGFGRRGCRGR